MNIFLTVLSCRKAYFTICSDTAKPSEYVLYIFVRVRFATARHIISLAIVLQKHVLLSHWATTVFALILRK